MARRTGRQRTQLPHCYYEGYLEKRSFKDKTSRKLWTCLCGNTLFFFNDKRDNDYTEKLDLSGFMSITDDSSQDRNLEAARLNLQMKDGNIRFTAPNAEARELWKGYIHSVAELSVPSSLNLLPGQIHMLKETVEEEKERIKSFPQPSGTNDSTYITVEPDMPHCYYEVSRLEAELLLERETKRGNMLLRPGREGKAFAVTTRQDLEGPVFKHYRVTRKPEGGFLIDVDNPVFCATLPDVIDYLVKKTEGVFIPLIMEGIYERRISFIWSDRENGEKSVLEAPMNPEESAQQAQVNPEKSILEAPLIPEKSAQKGPLNLFPPSLPPRPDSKSPSPEPLKEPDDESINLNDKVLEKEAEKENSSELPPSPPKKPLLPPTPIPRKLTPTMSSSSCTNGLQEVPGQTLSELKLKLQKKLKKQKRVESSYVHSTDGVFTVIIGAPSPLLAVCNQKINTILINSSQTFIRR